MSPKSNSQLKIFVAIPVLLEPDKAAGDKRLFVMLEMLAKRHQVDLCIFEPSGSEEEERQRYARIGVRLLPYRDRFLEHISAAMSRRSYDIGLFEFYPLALGRAWEFRRYNPSAKVIVDSVDVHFAREEAAAALGIGTLEEAQNTKKWELSTYRDADAVIVVSTLDRDILQAQENMSPLILVPIILAQRTRPKRERAREAVFVGGFRHPPNEDGIIWFTEKVWPIVRAAEPDAILTIIGSNATPTVERLGEKEGVQLLGYVPETDPYLDRAAISVAPLRYGAGMKGKVCEAMASGLPVVTTSVGAQGLDAVSGEHMEIADDADQFAESVIRLFRDPVAAERLGAAGQRHIDAICSPEAVEARLLQEIERIAGEPKPEPALQWTRYATQCALQPLRNARQMLRPSKTER